MRRRRHDIVQLIILSVLGGAVVLTLLPELLRGLNDYRMLIYAIVLIVMMLFNSSPKAIEMRAVFLEKMKKNKNAAKEAA